MPSTTLSPFRPPLAAPALLEADRSRLARELENYLSPLLDYCDAQQADDNLSEAGFRHVFALRQAVAALGRYDANAEALLDYYRQGLGAARQQAADQVPTLEQALGLPAPTPCRFDHEPLYRLGYVRGYRKASQHYERVVSLYAEHATLPVPPGYQPSPLVARLTAYLASPEAQAYAAQPLAIRQHLNAFSLPVPPTADHAEPGQIAA